MEGLSEHERAAIIGDMLTLNANIEDVSPFLACLYLVRARTCPGGELQIKIGTTNAALGRFVEYFRMGGFKLLATYEGHKSEWGLIRHFQERFPRVGHKHEWFHTTEESALEAFAEYCKE